MLTPMRSFTLPSGFWLSSLPTTSAAQPAVTRFKRKRGVYPINSVTLLAIFISSQQSSVYSVSSVVQDFRGQWHYSSSPEASAVPPSPESAALSSEKSTAASPRAKLFSPLAQTPAQSQSRQTHR